MIVLQGIDESGKDGTNKHVMTGLHPLGCRVIGFGVQTATELAHDYLWRVHQVVPGDGEISIFNRSHYEDVLVVRVHDLVPKARWSKRYDQINAFEQTLADEGTTILKFFLNISLDEQLERFKERYDDPTKRWKFKTGDLEERKRWDDYMAAYSDALGRCSTDDAPWYAIPADRKWFRNLAIAEIVADELERLDPRYPARDDLPKDLVIE
jgi:PPK2 family polyphosphate:nucleotide phosphotransferase